MVVQYQYIDLGSLDMRDKQTDQKPNQTASKSVEEFDLYIFTLQTVVIF